MRHSKVEIYLHIVWKTKDRSPLITDDIKRSLYRCIQSEVLKLKGATLAVGGTADHVHLLVRIGGSVSSARLVNAVKGVSSLFQLAKGLWSV